MKDSQSPIEAVISGAASKITYAGAGGSFLGWLTSSEIIGLIGILLAVGGFIVNWYYKHKEYKLKKIEAGITTTTPTSL